jgi:hypothetical protein
LDFIKAFMPDGRVVRITQPNGSQESAAFDRSWVDGVQYDIVVDEAPVSPNAMRELWESLQQTSMGEVLMNAGILSPDIIADIIPDVPESIRNRMRENAAEQDVMAQVLQLVSAGQGEEALQMLQQMAQQQEAA